MSTRTNCAGFSYHPETSHVAPHCRFAESIFDNWAVEYPEAKPSKGVSLRQAQWAAFIHDPRNASLRLQMEALLAPGEHVDMLLPSVWQQLCANVHDARFRDWSSGGVIHLRACGAVMQRSRKVLKGLFDFFGYPYGETVDVSEEE